MDQYFNGKIETWKKNCRSEGKRYSKKEITWINSLTYRPRLKTDPNFI